MWTILLKQSITYLKAGRAELTNKEYWMGSKWNDLFEFIIDERERTRK